MMQIGQHLDVFENLFQALDAPHTPMVCVTSIVDGKPLIEDVIEKDFLNPARKIRIESHQTAPNYLLAYKTPAGFDFPRLFNDDFFLAIRLTFNNRHYVSCVKLIVSFIYTVSYLEFGDTCVNFQSFLDKYADLSKLGVSSAELWEFRNAILHMTNNESRKVKRQTVKRLCFTVGEVPDGFPTESDGTKYFGLMNLIKAVAKALERLTLAWRTFPMIHEGQRVAGVGTPTPVHRRLGSEYRPQPPRTATRP